MQKSLYDSSCLIWAPQGRLYQVEYAMEAIGQGSCLLGLKSKTHVVLCGLKSTFHDKLSFHQDKLYTVSNHMGIGIAGLTSDGRLLHKYMKNECLTYNYVYDGQFPVERLVTKISESKLHITLESQKRTQGGDGKRPYGVGMLVSGFDKTGPRLFRTCPSGHYYEYFATAIGSRCQTANTYLENNLESYPTCSGEELIKHAIKAMKVSQDITLTEKNLDISIVGENQVYKKLSEEEIAPFLRDNQMVIDS